MYIRMSVCTMCVFVYYGGERVCLCTYCVYAVDLFELTFRC